jgi:type IV secretion system protein TrbC
VLRTHCSTAQAHRVCGEQISLGIFATSRPETAELPYALSLHGAYVVKLFFHRTISALNSGRAHLILLLGLLLATPAFAQGNSPWENAVNVLQLAFTSTIARGLSLVAIVVSGLTFAFGEGGSKRIIAGVLFGVGMAIAAVNFLAWLFPA